jgi:serine/threonine protein kinase
MMLKQRNLLKPDDAESFIGRFEEAWQHGDAPPLVSFLPDVSSPCYREVLAELIRIDLEYNFTHGRSRRVADYRAQFPDEFRSLEWATPILFEEYRLRLQAGNYVTPQEYARDYGVDTSKWPEPSPEVAVPTAVLRNAAALPDEVVGLMSQTNCIQVSPAPIPAKMPAEGDIILGYHLKETLGRGTFGQVFLAEQVILANRSVVLKISTDLTGEPQKLAQLQHTNIVPIYAYYRTGPLQILCMPYFGRTTLANVIMHLAHHGSMKCGSGRDLLSTLYNHRGTRLESDSSRFPAQKGVSDSVKRYAVAPSPPSAEHEGNSIPLNVVKKMTHVDSSLWIIARLADGLAHAHDRGILHRDLKPANVLITDDGQPMLLDFNLATDGNGHDPHSRPTRMGGTLAYMSPEHIRAMRDRRVTLDARSDLYSLGVMLFQLLTGSHPFKIVKGSLSDAYQDALAERQAAPPSARKLNPRVSRAVDAIVRRLMAPRPEDRYQSARQLLEDLEAQLDNRPLIHATDRSLKERLQKWYRHSPRRTTAVLIGLAATLFLILPATAGAIFQARTARRMHAIQGAEAIARYTEWRPRFLETQAHLLTQKGKGAVFLDARRKAENLIRSYRADSREWTDDPAVQLLPVAQRTQLVTDMEELQFIVRRLNSPAAITGVGESTPDSARTTRRSAADGLNLVKVSTQSGNRGGANPAESLSDKDLSLRAVAAVVDGQYKKAIPYLRGLTQRHPDRFASWYALGHSYLMIEKSADAAECFTACIALQPSFPWSYVMRAEARRQQNQLPAAIADCGNVARMMPSHPEFAIEQATLLLNAGQPHRAVELMDRVAEQRDGPIRAFIVRAQARQALGDAAGANRDREEIARRRPRTEDDWFWRAVERRVTQPKEALDDLDELLKLNPNHIHGRTCKAEILADRVNRIDDSLVVLNQLVEDFPDHVISRMGRAQVLARLGKVDSSLDDLAHGLDNAPSPRLKFHIACVLAQLSRWENSRQYVADAVRCLGEAVQSGFNDVEQLSSDPDLDPIRNDPSFQRILSSARTIRELIREKSE